MNRRLLILLLSLLLVPMLAPAPTAVAGAADHPHVVPLPDDFQPEGIAASGHTFYVGSLNDGDIYRGDLRSGEGALFVDTSGRQATGMEVDRAHGLLWVAGGFTGHAYAYDLESGELVADLSLAPAGQIVNDVLVIGDVAWFTNSFAPEIYRVPVTSRGEVGEPSTLTVTGPAAVNPPGGFGLNGIARGGENTLLVDHSALGQLFTVDTRTGASRLIPVSGEGLVPGTVDGLLRHGSRVYVVQNFISTVTEVRLAAGLSRGTVAASVTDPAFEVPTAIARDGRWLAVVNAKFNLGFPPPLGPGAPAGTPFEVVQFRAP